jgi:hypothetical protein
MCVHHWGKVPKKLRDRQVGLCQDLAQAFDQEARDFILANLAMNQVICAKAVQGL